MQYNKEAVLWNHAPYMDACGDQPAPALTPCVVPGSRGAVIVCPGGGYTFRAPHEGLPVAQMLQSAGVSAFVLSYRVSPCPHEAPLGDALRAVRVVRAMGYEQVAILGFSAGGHLACCAATMWDEGDAQAEDPVERLSSRPDAFIPCYAVTGLVEHTHVGTLCALLGENRGDAALQRRYSPHRNVTRDTPPAFIWHTAEDMSVPVENALNLAAALSRCGVPYEMHIFPEGKHGLGLAEEIPAASQWARLCCRWLLERGYGRD